MEQNPFAAPSRADDNQRVGLAPGDDIRDRDYTIGDVFSVAWYVTQSRLAQILALTVLVYIPVNMVLHFAGSEEMSFSTSMRLVQLLEALFGILVTLGVAIITNACLTGEVIGFGELLRRVFSRWGHAILTNIIAGFVLLGLALLLIVPAIIGVVFLMFTEEVVALKSETGSEALKYSRELVRGQWWRIAGYGLLFAVGTAAPYFALSFVAELFTELPAISIFTDTIGDIIASYFLVAATVLFLNVDHRRFAVREP